MMQNFPQVLKPAGSSRLYYLDCCSLLFPIASTLTPAVAFLNLAQPTALFCLCYAA